MHPRRQIAIALQLQEPYPQHQDVLAGVQKYIRQHEPNWEYVIDEHPGYKARRRPLQYQRYDGVIARASLELQRRMKRQRVALVNTWYQHARPSVPGVYIDWERMGRLAAEHMIERGFRRIAYFTIAEHRACQKISRGFSQCVSEQGHECQVEHYPEEPADYRDYLLILEQYMEKWLDQLIIPVGVVLEDPTMARMLIAACESRGWKMPREIAVLCTNNIRSIVDLPPQLSSIEVNYERVGYEAAALLDRLLEGEAPTNMPILVPPKSVIARESTDYFAVEDETVASALAYISEHLRDNLTVDRIAREIAVSRRSLQRRFESALGHAVTDEIRRLRLEKAKRMLGENDLTVKQIARLTGFNQPITMNHVFHREVGMSPSEYREKLLG